MPVIEGNLTAKSLKIAIVVSRFNEFITSRLLEGARDCFKRHGGALDDLDIAWVPGAFEIPLVAQSLAQKGDYHAIICLGAIIKGATAHFDHVAGSATSGITQASLKTDTPIIFGVLTTDTIEQAIERAGSKAGNKGHEACLAAIEMANLMDAMNSHKTAILPSQNRARSIDQ